MSFFLETSSTTSPLSRQPLGSQASGDAAARLGPYASSSASRRASRFATQPSSIDAGTPLASAPGGTSRFTTAPAPVYAPSPISTGATSTVLDPVRASAPTLVR